MHRSAGAREFHSVLPVEASQQCPAWLQLTGFTKPLCVFRSLVEWPSHSLKSASQCGTGTAMKAAPHELQSAVSQRVPFHLISAQLADDEDKFGSGLCCAVGAVAVEKYRQNDTPELADSALQRKTMSCSPRTGNHLAFSMHPTSVQLMFLLLVKLGWTVAFQTPC